MTMPNHGGVARRLLVGLATLACCASCSLLPPSSQESPPPKICGKRLSDSPAWPVVQDATSQNVTVTAVTVGNVIMLRVASGCRSGADVAVDPGDAAGIVDDIRASDGRYTAVVLQPHRDAFTVRVRRSPTSVSVVTVEGLTVQAPTAAPTS